MAVADQVITERYALYCGDAVEAMKPLHDEQAHLSIYSPPFGTNDGAMYKYSSDYRDLSNCKNYAEFMEQYNFTVDEIFRITMPGRMTAVHCIDVPSGNSGKDWLMDFPGDIVRLHTRCRKPTCGSSAFDKERGICGHGNWKYVGRYHVWKEPLTVRNRTMRKDLAHKTIVEDSSWCGAAWADYVLMFRRAGTNNIPITHTQGLLNYAGWRKMPAEYLRYKGWTGDQIQNRYSHWIWRQYASSFWDDVRLDRVLPYREARDSEDEAHVHPLQLDVIERLCVLWSNPNEVIFTPFMGVGSEVCGAIANGRRAIGAELKSSYFNQAKKNAAHVREHGLEDASDQIAMAIAPEEIGDLDIAGQAEVVSNEYEL